MEKFLFSFAFCELSEVVRLGAFYCLGIRFLVHGSFADNPR
uniref:Uncharacterized protein n=1 Tax=Arundo donax TaxID=35708 RepID=A0A0A9FYE0_ARUDO